MTPGGGEAHKQELKSLATSAGVPLDPTVLDLLVELVLLGVQPKDIAPYLRAVIARSVKPPTALNSGVAPAPARLPTQ